jgi:hypothetical protein
MKKSGLVALGAMLVAGSALASNTGFKLNYPLVFGAGSTNTNWISPPFFYFPNGNVNQPQQNSIDMCADLNDFALPPAKVTQLIKWNPTSATSVTQNCGTITKVAFNLAVAEAYAAVPPGAGIVVNIVGSMNDAYAPNKGGATRYPLQFQAGSTNTNWTSFPYHLIGDNSLDVCAMFTAQLGAGKIPQLIKWNPDSATSVTQNCSTTTKMAFVTAPGEAYAIVPQGTGLAVGFDVY